MKQKKSEFAPLNFKEQTPNMQIAKVKVSKLYEKAFLSHCGETQSEFSQNTTTFD